MPKSPENEKGKIESLFLPREQYAEASQKYGRSPFTLEIKNEKQKLFYFAANHSRNPRNEQYPKLRSYWSDFLKETAGKDRIVLVEGWLKPPASNELEAIKNGAEGDFITYLAHQQGVPVVCPDLSPSELMTLLPEFTKEEFLLSEFVMYADHLKQRLHRRLSVLPSLQAWCDWEKKQKTWEGLEITPENILEVYERILRRPFNEEENFNAIENPNNTGTRINDLNRAASNLRDARIVSEIRRYWDEGKNILVVFGSGHLIIEEPALRALLK